jgi:YXWGXW repeat-containing protein
MNAKRTLALAVASATVWLAVFATTPAASASPRIDVGIRVAVPPPPLRPEVVVVRPGPYYVWVPGYWNWAPYRHRYIWVGGAWVRPPHRHAVWVRPRWVRRGHASFYIRGHWRY